MSLDWDVSKVKDHENLCWIEEENPPSRGPGTHRRVNPITEALVFHTVTIGMYAITESNAKEFYGRVRFIELHRGPSVTDFTGTEIVGRPITLEDVQAHVGLRTNASTEALSHFLMRNFKYFNGLT